MSFDPIAELKNIVNEIEGKVPTKIEDLLQNKVKFLKENGITDNMHVGKTSWTLTSASEWLLSMFIGIVEKGKADQKVYSAFGTWLHHVYHFIIDNKPGLPEK